MPPSGYVRPAPHFNIRKTPAARHMGSQYLFAKKHTARQVWHKTQWYSKPFFGVTKHVGGAPRMLLDRDIYRLKWAFYRNLPDSNRWEKLSNGKRVSEDRFSLVEEDGELHKVNWKLYSDRLNAEMQATVDHLAQYSLFMAAVPSSWRKLDIAVARIRGLSLREAMAQCKLSHKKGHNVLYRALEMAQQGAETKGLDKEKLRVSFVTAYPGPPDKQIDIRSRGYYAWRTKKSSHIMLTLSEDPEMTLPDRAVLPFKSQLAMRRAGINPEAMVLDVPAITAEGI
jgi:ribosomal protein L22